MLRIYLTRHGQDQDNKKQILNGHRDTYLTETGIKQAKELATKIKNSNIHFNEIYSSPLQRAYHTAFIIRDEIGYHKINIVNKLIERNFGIMTGVHKSKIKQMCASNLLETETVTYFLCPQGSETYPEVKERAKQVLKDIKNHHKSGNILIVSHGCITKMLYAAYYNIHWKKALNMFHVGNGDLILLSEDSPVEATHVEKIKQYNN